ncbi:hypothetical protein WFJ45_23175, partial [Salmonella enterica subsp. enterica serovar Minnesota]|uniref:hypothetical protein n=1 Tax=Salmonella enterica TaxID=28901 RepID=UPI003D265771
SGKSSLLRAVSWLLSGQPAAIGGQPAPTVRAELVPTSSGERRTIERSPESSPQAPLPSVVFLAAHDR